MIKPIDKTHWEDLYARLHDAYVECMKHNNPTYEQKLAQVLDHMIIKQKSSLHPMTYTITKHIKIEHEEDGW